MMRAPATPDGVPWNSRRYSGGVPRKTRTSFDIDCDRIVHSESFRDLQHKTQVQGVSGSAAGTFRTRLNHVIEVAQLAAGIATDLEVNTALARAIALAHDLGHPPFGHAGERALDRALRSHAGIGWNANTHSLTVVDELERTYIEFRGLNLTWATREGIARHSTPFDRPSDGADFGNAPNGGIECQIVDVADVLAYIAHDLDDALQGEFISLSEIAELGIVGELVQSAEAEWEQALSPWPSSESAHLIRRYVVAKLISRTIRDIVEASAERIAELGVDGSGVVRRLDERVIVQSDSFSALTRSLLDLLTARYYKSSVVANKDAEAEAMIEQLFEWLLQQPDALPARFRGPSDAQGVANYVASLNDPSAERLAEEAGIEAAMRADRS